MDNLVTEQDIHRVIKLLQENVTLLKVSFENQSNRYSSALINASIDEGFLTLDDFLPQPPSYALTPNTAIEIHTQLNGASIAFETTLIETGNESGIDYHKVKYPSELRYHQRRRYFRVPLKRIGKHTAKLEIGELGTFTGHIEDISVNGTCISFEESEIMKLQPGMIINNCTLDLPDSPLTCSINVRNRHMSVNRKRYLLRCQFDELENFQKKSLNREITRFQRELIRLSKRHAETHHTLQHSLTQE